MKILFWTFLMLLVSANPASAMVNINTATKEELTSIKGVGAERAQSIVDYRTKNGPFKSVDDLEKVPGVGPGLMKRIRSQISTGSSSANEKPAQKAAKTPAVKMTPPTKTQGLKSDQATGKVAEKLTTK
jgi:competence protein ComEA